MKTCLMTVAVAALCACSAALAQSKLVRLVVPYPPGGVDATMRLMLPTMEKELGQPWVFEYHSGASGIIGHQYVARQPADGSTFLITLANSMVVAAVARRSMPFEPERDFTPISIGYESIGVIVAHPSFAPNNLKEMVAWAKANPGRAAWATSGIASSWHINGEIAKKRGDFDVLHAPYQGFGPMIPAILGGQVQMAMISYSVIAPMIAAGKVKMLGVTNTDPRLKSMVPPGAMTLADIAPGMESMPDWVGLAGPAGVPDPLVRRVQAAYAKALRTPEMMERWQKDLTLPIGSTPEEFARRLREDLVLVREAVKLANVPLQE
jgi:tripartite-type tricarboxylate transporter receptor subunit TctC